MDNELRKRMYHFAVRHRRIIMARQYQYPALFMTHTYVFRTMSRRDWRLWLDDTHGMPWQRIDSLLEMVYGQ